MLIHYTTELLETSEYKTVNFKMTKSKRRVVPKFRGHIRTPHGHTNALVSMEFRSELLFIVGLLFPVTFFLVSRATDRCSVNLSPHTHSTRRGLRFGRWLGP